VTTAKERISSSASSRALTATDSSAGRILAGQDGIKQWQEEVYRAMHQHPELSNQEQQTAATAADTLRKAGYEVNEKIGTTGVVGILKNGNGPAVLVSADMDALPIKEDTGLPYASTEQQGRSQTWL
jgi:metal-dependent amidase/aminoacylase/carboxypeptidase family protein